MRRLALLLCGLFVVSCIGRAAPETLLLQSDMITLEVSPRLGGRVLFFGLQGRDNLLKVNPELVAQPPPEADATAGAIHYMGHEVWLGPQSEWWSHQKLNADRLSMNATWPPDPYLSFAPNRVLERRADAVVLEGVKSPISGMQVRKAYRLGDRPDQVIHDVAATNLRSEQVAWDIWFNTRVRAQTQVYVPVDSSEDIRVNQMADADFGPIEFSVADGMLSLTSTPPPAGELSLRGKLFIQPSAGWLAGFARGQVFIIQFRLQPREKIHPEHGQVELYLEVAPEQQGGGMLEMEVHAPYTQLAPGQAMEARELWTVLPYDGPDTPEAHRAFLRSQRDLLEATDWPN